MQALAHVPLLIGIDWRPARRPTGARCHEQVATCGATEQLPGAVGRHMRRGRAPPVSRKKRRLQVTRRRLQKSWLKRTRTRKDEACCESQCSGGGTDEACCESQCSGGEKDEACCESQCSGGEKDEDAKG
eukprot:365826-Chlamydomonas_euryale.AAC.11